MSLKKLLIEECKEMALERLETVKEWEPTNLTWE